MHKRDEVENWAVHRAQQIVMREGMDLVLSARDLDPKIIRIRGKQLAMAIATSLVEASAVQAD
ncbi:hypothetical protein QO002_000668 [Pararhizobium capsulatum DSM 1112]|uniref:Uncharacterized protein n=1 Tax=Pararhizobium capsulatum DSM 1112 TaxID=1121113 RepID=A0ABU0BM49_9HYPH|nr:hypothetical protein [Pararhizobium capsulatum]MDQ0318530.1 hypothetical protein [Pararhizobium capsulatum DSM 1112]